MHDDEHAIGGYFELELANHGPIFHSEHVSLNSGRNCLEYLLSVDPKKKLYIPYYTCDVLLQPIRKLGIDFEFYHIDLTLEPIFDFGCLNDQASILYTNYFGLKDQYIEKELPALTKHAIVDNSQAFFSSSSIHFPCFYSPRKFFGVPDGGFLSTNLRSDFEFSQAESVERFEHLIVRIEKGPSKGYPLFKAADQSLDYRPIEFMSSLTRRILQSIDYKYVQEKRRANYKIVADYLDPHNSLILEGFNATATPMSYPFYFPSRDFRQILTDNKIYTPKYWPNVHEWLAKKAESLEISLADFLIPIPIDQRYSTNDMETIAHQILKEIS